MTLSRIVLAVLRLGLLAALLPDIVEAQTYPAKPIRIVVPWAPGGSTDVLARLIGIKMSENWGQPAVVENKPGASGNIGSDLVAKALPDGYTLLLGSVSTHAMNPFLMANMPFKGVDNFSTVALAAYVTNVLVTHPSVPAKSVQQLIDLLKAQPGRIAYASAGNGSPNHVAAELFRRLAGVDMLHVPYKGGGPATAANCRRTGGRALHRPGQRLGARESRPAQPARGHGKPPLGASAERADGGRGAPGLRGRGLVRRVGAGGDAARSS